MYNHNRKAIIPQVSPQRPRDARIRPDPRQHEDPLGYDHPYPSMAEVAKRLALRTDPARTRHSYYRDMRVLHGHFGCDPATLTEDQFRDFILHVKTVKNSVITKHVKTNAKSNVLNVKTTVKTNVKTVVTHVVNTTTNKYSKMFKTMNNRSLFHVGTATTNNVQIAQIATAIKAY